MTIVKADNRAIEQYFYFQRDFERIVDQHGPDPQSVDEHGHGERLYEDQGEFVMTARIRFNKLYWCLVAIFAAGCSSGGAFVEPEPQGAVVCTGWHALCTASTDCKLNGDKVTCDCLRVNETHIVLTNEIQDAAVKNLTQAKCTIEHPCGVDQAPVCNAIKSGQYTVDNVKYDWVSTYSYRGWCSLLGTELKACDVGAPRYTGDSSWAICDVAPCTENQRPSNPDKPLSCQCRVQKTPFVGTNGSCTGDNGGIMSSMELGAWDFRNNTYRIPVPGYEYVQGACAPLKSDPLPPR